MVSEVKLPYLHTTLFFFFCLCKQKTYDYLKQLVIQNIL